MFNKVMLETSRILFNTSDQTWRVLIMFSSDNTKGVDSQNSRPNSIINLFKLSIIVLISLSGGCGAYKGPYLVSSSQCGNGLLITKDPPGQISENGKTRHTIGEGLPGIMPPTLVAVPQSTDNCRIMRVDGEKIKPERKEEYKHQYDTMPQEGSVWVEVSPGHHLILIENIVRGITSHQILRGNQYTYRNTAHCLYQLIPIDVS